MLLELIESFKYKHESIGVGMVLVALVDIV